METPNQQPHTIEQKKDLTSLEKLKTIISRISEEINQELQEKSGLKGLVDTSLHVDPTFFSQKEGGAYLDEVVANDQATVDSLDRFNCAADEPSTQKFYKETYGIETPEGIVAKHLEKKESSKSNQAEMIITALLHKILKERFLVVRSSVFDDYKNGIDNLILDKETGAIICAFDEVLENEGDKNKTPAKIDKIKKKAILGGTEAKYGVSLKDGKIIRDRPRNIPIFYLALESKDLQELTNDLFYNQQGDLTEVEEKLFSHLVSSIREQKQILEKLNLPPVMKRKLEGFEESLATLESFVTKKD